MIIPVAMILNMLLIFGLFMNPISQRVIFSGANGQSLKLVAVWKHIEPIPSLASLAPALLVTPIIYSTMFALLYHAIPGKSGIRKGFLFGVILWSLIAVFFELFTPYGLFGEPLQFLLYELTLWFIGLTTVGTVIGMIYNQRYIGPK